jgi:hypothetical protein
MHFREISKEESVERKGIDLNVDAIVDKDGT